MLAYVHLSKGDYKDALEPFADATRLMAKSNTKPFVESFNLKYAIAAQLAGRTDDAAERLYDAMGANASYLDAYMQYIFQSQEQTSIVQSVAILNKISERRPDDASVHLYLGLLNSYAKFYPAALAAFEKAEQLAADSPEREDILTPVFYFWFAAACERSGMIDRAEELFNKCIELDAAHAEAYNYLAYMWAEKGVKLDQAMDMIRKALKLDPTSGAFIDTLGWIYFMQGKYDDALKSIGKASEILPDDPTIIEHMGSVHDKLGEPEKALEYWKQSFALDPTNEALATKLKDLGVDLEPLREKAKELEKQREEEEQEEEGVQEGEPAETEPDAETEPAPEPAPKDAAPAASPNE
jgi:tetratricopeptide (TPR) repeat protein